MGSKDLSSDKTQVKMMTDRHADYYACLRFVGVDKEGKIVIVNMQIWAKIARSRYLHNRRQRVTDNRPVGSGLLTGRMRSRNHQTISEH